MKRLSTQTLRELVYTAIVDAMVNGELKPGDRVRDADIAEQLGVSRTPVREALRQLEDQGLIRTFRGSRTEVAPVDERSARDAYILCAGLFGLAARLGVPHITPADLEDMEKANREFQRAKRAQDTLEAIDADYRFVLVLVRAAGNSELERMIRSLLPKIRLLDYRFVVQADVKQSAMEHAAIIAACRAGDQDEAARLVEINMLPRDGTSDLEHTEDLPRANGAKPPRQSRTTGAAAADAAAASLPSADAPQAK
jgi:DNA-binding GntR family transcriptional regulator